MADYTDEQLWDAFQSVYEPGSRNTLESAQRDYPDVLDGLRAVAAQVTAKARQEALNEAGFATQWAHGHFNHGAAEECIDRVSEAEALLHYPSGHRADLSPYWNYRTLTRQVGPWVEVRGNDERNN